MDRREAREMHHLYRCRNRRDRHANARGASPELRRMRRDLPARTRAEHRAQARLTALSSARATGPANPSRSGAPRAPPAL